MVEEVNKIIYNMLISGRGVYLPEVGTLFIERQGARRIAKDRLLSPRNVVAFSSQEQAPSLVDEIVAIAGCQQAQAQDIYARWREKTREGNDITIGGIGVLRGKSFTADKSFAAAINPKGVKTLVVRRRRSNTWIYIVCGVAVVAALAIFAFLQWGSDLGFGGQTSKYEVQPVAEPVAEVVTEADTEPAAETAEPENTKTVAKPIVAESQGYPYYVVMGVFSTEENAARAVAQLRSKIKEATGEVLPYGEKYMVTAFGSNSRSECNLFVGAYSDVYPDLWVYNKK